MAALWGLVALCGISPHLEAQDLKMALASDGTVYRLQQGTYGELFPAGTAAYPDHHVLALDVLLTGGGAERRLVPGTAGWDPESSASMVFEKNARVVYLLWQTRVNGIHPLLFLVSFDGAAWSEVIEITSGPFTEKGSPQLAVTREAASGGRDRAILHLTWWEEAPGATSRKRYAPIVIEGGRHIGTVPVYDLASFVPAGDGSSLPSDAAGLEDSLSLRAGRNDHAVAVGFLNPDTHRVSTLEVEMLPRALNDLADKIRGHIVVVGNRQLSRTELAASVHAELLELATDFHQAAREYLADLARETIESSLEAATPDGIPSLADLIRGHIVVVGSRIQAGGLESDTAAGILAIGPTEDGRYHYLKVSSMFDRTAPEVGGPAEILLSESGRNVLLTWEDEGSFHYVESLAEGWSEAGVIELTDELDRETVHRMLEDRVGSD